MDFLGGLVVKSPSAKAGDAGDTGSIPLWERSPSGEGRGNPLQCSCLKNPTDGAVWWATIHGVAELDMTEWLNTYICNWYNVPCPKPCLLLSGNNEDTVHCQGKKNYTLTQLKKKNDFAMQVLFKPCYDGLNQLSREGGWLGGGKSKLYCRQNIFLYMNLGRQFSSWLHHHL